MDYEEFLKVEPDKSDPYDFARYTLYDLFKCLSAFSSGLYAGYNEKYKMKEPENLIQTRFDKN